MNDVIKGTSTTDMLQKKFLELTKNLIDVMVEFSLLTLRTIQKKKGSPLTMTQIEDTIYFDLQFRLLQINDPEFLDLIRERANLEFRRKHVRALAQ